jgi:hypothetical protein
MKFTHSKNHTIEDADKYIGSTIVQTMSKDPLMQRVGLVVDIRSHSMYVDTTTFEIYWQPCSSMPMGRPYPSSHLPERLGDYYFIK